MSEFGVHSEVGKLRKVMVHRPDLSLKRLTPTNHDDLLFDDVLWVERAQYEHDQFVERDAGARRRGLPARRTSSPRRWPRATRAATRLIELVVSEYTVGWSLVDEIRELLAGPQARPAGEAPHRRAHRRRGGARPGARPPRPASSAPRSTTTSQFVLPPLPEHAVHPRLVVLDLRRRVGQPDVLAGPPP